MQSSPVYVSTLVKRHLKGQKPKRKEPQVRKKAIWFFIRTKEAPSWDSWSRRKSQPGGHEVFPGWGVGTGRGRTLLRCFGHSLLT